MPTSNRRISNNCFILRDSTRIGTILRYVRNQRVAGHHAVCAQSHGFLAPGQCADGFFQPSLGPQKRRTASFCASRTPTSSAASCAFATSSWPICAGWDWTGMRGRMSAGPRRRIRQAQRGEFYRAAVRAIGGARTSLSVLLHAAGSGAVAKAAAHVGQAAALCRNLPGTDGGAARRAGGARPEADAAVCRAGDENHRIHRRGTRAAAICAQRHRRLHHSPRRRHAGVLLLQCRR